MRSTTSPSLSDELCVSGSGSGRFVLRVLMACMDVLGVKASTCESLDENESAVSVSLDSEKSEKLTVPCEREAGPSPTCSMFEHSPTSRV